MGEDEAALPWMEEEKDNFNAGMEISTTAIVVSLSIGLVAFSGVLIPNMALGTGYINSMLVVLVLGFITYYTASLIIVHLGRGSSMKESILAHFGGDYRYMRGYGFVNMLSFMPMIMISFNFVCIEIQGMLGYPSVWVGPIAALFFMVLIIILRIKHFAEQTMALGAIGIILFIVFMIWAWATAPGGSKQVQPAGNMVSMASSFLTLYAVHNFLAQNLIKHHNKGEYQSILKKIFTFGVLYYIFSSFGSFAIVDRKQYIKPAQVLTDYFPKGNLEVLILQIINIVLVISFVPNFLLVSMIRFFQVCSVDLHAHITLKEVVYIVTVMGVCLGIFVSGVRIQTMLSLNGALLGYCYMIVFPIWMHFKCIFFDKNSGFIYDDPQWNKSIVQNVCECDCFYKKKWKLYLETAFLIFVLLFGLGLLIETIIGTFQPQNIPYHHK